MKIWRVIRTLTFIVVGLINTVFIRAEDVGSWKNYIGYLLIVLAIYDITAIVMGYLKSRKEINN